MPPPLLDASAHKYVGQHEQRWIFSSRSMSTESWENRYRRRMRRYAAVLCSNISVDIFACRSTIVTFTQFSISVMCDWVWVFHQPNSMNEISCSQAQLPLAKYFPAQIFSACVQYCFVVVNIIKSCENCFHILLLKCSLES